MFGIKTSISKALPSAEKIVKNINFGTAVGLTKTAKEGQAAVIGAWRGSFTIRSPWLERSPIGPKITPATATSQFSEVKMSARFGPLQDKGGIKLPYKHYLAMPADAGPLNKAKRIPIKLRPANLQNAFILTTKSGTKLLCVRKLAGRGKNRKSGVVPMYVLIPRANVKAKNVFYEPIKKVADRRLLRNVNEGIDKALRTMK
jgi:hypothetical protein